MRVAYVSDTYYISIDSQEELEVLNDLRKYNGLCLFERVDKVGKWHWDDEKEEFVFDGAQNIIEFGDNCKTEGERK